MAIQKNFVVKNGLEVDTDLIFADAENNKVGIGTTIITAALHVRGGIAATDLNVGGISTFQTIVAAGPIAAGSLTSVGGTGQYLKSTYTGVEWSSFPDFRVVQTYTASDGQYVFGLEHTPNEIDVYVNGVKLSSSEFTDSSVDVTLFSPTNEGDIVELIGYGVLGKYSSGGSISGITVLDEGTPVGTVDMITSINFVGGDVVAAGTGAGVTVTITPTNLNYIEGDARITGILTVGQSSVVIDGPRNSIDSGTITTKELNVTNNPYSSLDFRRVVDNPISVGSTEIILDRSFGVIVGDKISISGILTEVSIVAIGTVAVTPYNKSFLNTFTPVNISIGSTAISVASIANVSIGNSISIVGFLTNVPVVGFTTVANPGIGLGYVNAVLISPGFAKTTLISFNSPVGFSSVVTQKDTVLIGSGSTVSVGIASASSALIQRFTSPSSQLNILNLNATGIVTAGIVSATTLAAGFLYGDGSGLTNLPVNANTGIGTQWETTDVGIHTFAKVGIGTTAKTSYSLDIDGDLNFSGTLYQNGSSFVASRWSAGDGNKIYRNSEVGIGTTNPVTNLHLEGGLKVTGPIYDYADAIGSVGYVLSSDGSRIEWVDGTSLGAQGTQGIQGTLGVQGTLGAQGNEGYVGEDGSQGAQGSDGTQGFSGNQGSQGPSGPQGIAGVIGPTGLQGLSGEFAGQGTQGTLGENGTQGSNGTQGLSGEFAGQGTQGTQGVQGSIGSQGIQGVKGDATELSISSISTGSFSVALTRTGIASTSVISYGDEVTNSLAYNASIPGVGIGTTNISSSLHIGAGRSTANGAPIKVNAGTLLATPEGNAIEYDGLNLYVTQNDTTNGTKRAFVDSTQFYRLSSDQSEITATSTETSVSWFGSGSSIALLGGYYYEIEYGLFYNKTTSNGSLTLNFSSSSSSGYTSLTTSSVIFGPDIAGGVVNAGIAQTVTMSPTASMTLGTFGMVCVKGLAIPAANCQMQLKAHVSNGGIIPKQDSYIKVRCLGNANAVGNFA